MNNKKGFTLVEIMIVVVIIGLLAAMAIPAFQRVRARSIEGTLENDGRQIASAANQYFMDYGVTTVASGDIIGAKKFIEKLSRGVSLKETSIAVGSNFNLKVAETNVADGGTMNFEVNTGKRTDK